MGLHTRTTVTVKNETFKNISDVHIVQQLANHDHFEVHVIWDQFVHTGNAILLKAHELIGEQITIHICDHNKESKVPDSYFEGIVTEVDSTKNDESLEGDVLILRGSGSTILLEDGPHCQGYELKKLSEMVNMATSAYSSRLPMLVKPLFKEVVPYVVQYNSSAYAFLQYLATRFGEWLYYDGTQLVFGSGKSESIDLFYGVNLMDFNMRVRPTAKKFKVVTHDYVVGDTIEESFQGGTDMPGDYAIMADKAEKLFPTETLVDFHHHAGDGDQQKNLTAALTKQKEAKVAQSMLLTGKSLVPGLAIGHTINIVHKTNDSETTYGSFVITAVRHSCTESGNYSNRFEAIPEGAVYPPYTNVVAMPTCGNQRAKVVDNADPEGLGRIKVQMAWQKDAPTPWIRIAQPHGGADKGFHFIPEKGEEVMVGFEGGNAEMPFVMGTLYNGKAKPEAFTTETNDIKAIRTRSGHTIELNDKDGAETIKIYDNEGSIITFDTKAKSLSINSAETIEIGAKNINITAEENIVIGAKANIDIAADGDLNEQAKGNVTVQSDGDSTINSGGALAMSATSDATLSGMNTILEGKTKAELNGTQTKITGKALSEVAGGTIKLN